MPYFTQKPLNVLTNMGYKLFQAKPYPYMKAKFHLGV